MRVCVTFVCVCVCVYGYMCLRSAVVWTPASRDISLKSVSTLIPRLFFFFCVVSLFFFLLTGSPVALGHVIPDCSTRIFVFLRGRASVLKKKMCHSLAGWFLFWPSSDCRSSVFMFSSLIFASSVATYLLFCLFMWLQCSVGTWEGPGCTNSLSGVEEKIALACLYFFKRITSVLVYI